MQVWNLEVLVSNRNCVLEEALELEDIILRWDFFVLALSYLMLRFDSLLSGDLVCVASCFLI